MEFAIQFNDDWTKEMNCNKYVIDDNGEGKYISSIWNKWCEVEYEWNDDQFINKWKESLYECCIQMMWYET